MWLYPWEPFPSLPIGSQTADLVDLADPGILPPSPPRTLASSLRHQPSFAPLPHSHKHHVALPAVILIGRPAAMPINQVCRLPASLLVLPASPGGDVSPSSPHVTSHTFGWSVSSLGDRSTTISGIDTPVLLGWNPISLASYQFPTEHAKFVVRSLTKVTQPLIGWWNRRLFHIFPAPPPSAIPPLPSCSLSRLQQTCGTNRSSTLPGAILPGLQVVAFGVRR